VPTALDDDQDQKNIADEQFQNLVNRNWSPEEQEQLRKEADGEEATNSSGLSSDELKSAEESAGNPATTKAEKAEKEEASRESLFNPDKDKPSKRDGFWTRRKKAIGGGVVGLAVGGFGIFSILQGPLQFIHISQLLQRFHFASLEDNGNSRTLKLYKYVKNVKAGTVENTNLGKIGQRIASRIDTKLEGIGLTKTYTGTLTSTYDGMLLDPVKFSENAENGSQFKGLGEDDFKSRFQEVYGVEPQLIDADNNLWKIPPEEGLFSWFKNRSMNKLIVAETSTDGMAGSISARIMGKRDAVTWHPIRRLDAKITGALDAKFTAWLAEMKERIKRGEAPSIDAQGAKDTDPKDQSKQVDNPENDKAAGEVNQTGKDAQQALDDTAKSGETSADGLIKQFTHSTTGKLTMGAAAATGLLCAAKGIADSADSLRHDLVILPLIRSGVQAISLGNQVMSGQDIDMDQLGFFAKQFNDPENGSWASARSIQAELGQEQTGPDIPEEASISALQEGNIITQLLNKIPGLGFVCNALNSGIGRAFSFALSALTPVSTLVTEGMMRTPVAREAVAGLIRWVAGSPIPVMVTGPTFGNYINYGARLGSNDANLALGGRKLDPKESAALKNYQMAVQRQELESQSFAERIFDPYSPDSLVAKAIDGSSTNIGSNMASVFSEVLNPLKSMAAITAPFSKRANAAAPANYNYGFDEIGFSLDELNSKDFEDPYANSDAAINTLNIPCETVDQNGNTVTVHPCGPDYIDAARFCFGVNMSPDGTVDSGLSAKIDPLSKEYDNYNRYGITCRGTDKRWTQIRFYILDMKTAESMDCYLSGDDNSCNSVGMGGSSTTPSPTSSGAAKGQDTSSQTCSVGQDAGPGDTPDQNIKIRLCNVGGIIVNVAIEKNIKAILDGGKSAGLVFGGSGYRSYRRQIELRQQNCGTSNYDVYQKPSSQCSPPTAIPGNSMHEWGLAVDLTCGGSQVSRSSPCFKWLEENQGTHQLLNLPSEAWHWSSTGT
jgi:hypothetical protein